MGRAFSSAYLAGDASAAVFLPGDFRAAETRIQAVRGAAQRTISPALLTVLRQQQAALPRSPARQENLEALAAGGAAVVVSGQQVGLFLGPLYTVYKAATAIAAARALQDESGVRCVPLFWLQTEDHDFAEIAAVTVAGRDGGPVSLTLTEDRAGDGRRSSVAYRTLGPELPSLLDALAEALPAAPAAEELLALLRAYYRPGRTVAAAFGDVLAALFADEGLLVMEPRDARVAALAAPVYRTAIDTAATIATLLARRGGALTAAGFAQQIPVRPNCALLFFHRGGAEGPRFRLQGGGDDWALSGAPGETYTTATLAQLLARDPLRFSTSAMLRPIVQDRLLPTAAYVGGPGEINYYAQLAPLYEHFDVPPSLLLPRARFRCLDARARRLAQSVPFPLDELARPLSELRARLPLAVPSGAPDPAALRHRIAEQLLPVVDDVTGAVERADLQLGRPARRTRQMVARGLTRLVDRYATTLATRDQLATDRLERLRQALYPEGVPQERYYGWASLAGRVGPAAFKRMLLDSLVDEGPFSPDLRELRP